MIPRTPLREKKSEWRKRALVHGRESSFSKVTTSGFPVCILGFLSKPQDSLPCGLDSPFNRHASQADGMQISSRLPPISCQHLTRKHFPGIQNLGIQTRRFTKPADVETWLQSRKPNSTCDNLAKEGVGARDQIT